MKNTIRTFSWASIAYGFVFGLGNLLFVKLVVEDGITSIGELIGASVNICTLAYMLYGCFKVVEGNVELMTTHMEGDVLFACQATENFAIDQVISMAEKTVPDHLSAKEAVQYVRVVAAKYNHDGPTTTAFGYKDYDGERMYIAVRVLEGQDGKAVADFEKHAAAYKPKADPNIDIDKPEGDSP